MAASTPEAPPVALVVVAQSEYAEWEPLTELPAAARALADALVAAGYRLELPALLDGGGWGDVVEPLDDWLRGLPSDARLILYWTGHGAANPNHYLVLRNSPRTPSPVKALATRDLGAMIAQSKAEKVLVVLDTCYASGGAGDLAGDLIEALNRRTALPGQVRFASVLPSVHALQKAQEGVFCRALLHVLTEDRVEGRRWTDQDALVATSALSATLLGELQRRLGPTWQPSMPVSIGFDDLFLPNPRFRRDVPVLDVETRRLLVPEALALAARGVEAGEPGRYFTGRDAVLATLREHLARGTGVLVVTGAPGSGKSAVLGALLTETDGPDAADAVLHAKGATLRELGADLERQLGGDDAPTVLPGRRIVLDGLDEAREPAAVAGLVRRAPEAGARVIVGTRRSPDGRPLPEDAGRHDRLRALLGSECRIVDLDDDPDTAGDIARYVMARLLRDPRSRHRDDAAGVERIAHAVAAQAGGAFLYARVVSRTLMDTNRLDTAPLPAGALAAFQADLDSRLADRRDDADALLGALAWAEGRGLSRAAWPLVAGAVAGRRFDDDDIEWVLARGGTHVLEAGEAGQTVYRLAHQSFADLYRGRVADPADVHRAIADALTGDPPRQGAAWIGADRYVQRHLADHAAQGGRLDALVHDPGFLAAANPSRLLRALWSAELPTAAPVASLYRRIGEQLKGLDPPERMAHLHLLAAQERPELAAALEPPIPPRWRARWARWRPSIPSTLVATFDRPATAAVLVPPATLVVAHDGDLRAWDLGSLTPLAASAGVHADVKVLAAAVTSAGPVVVAGDAAGGLTVLAMPGMEHRAHTEGHATPVTALSVIETPHGPLLASGDQGGQLALWHLPGLQPAGRRATGLHEVVALAAAMHDGAPVVVTAGEPVGWAAHALTAWSVAGLGPVAAVTLDAALLRGVVAVPLAERRGVLIERFGDVRLWVPGDVGAGAETRTEGALGPWGVVLSADAGNTSVLLGGNAALHVLDLRPGPSGLDVRVGPLLQVEPGSWHGTVPVGGRHVVASVGSELRAWDVEDLVAAAAVAPPTLTDLLHVQRGSAVFSMAVTEIAVWSAIDAGPLGRWEPATGTRAPESGVAGDRISALAAGRDATGALLATVADGSRIRTVRAGTLEPAGPDVTAGGRVTAIAVTSARSAPLVAAALEALGAETRARYGVRLWDAITGREHVSEAAAARGTRRTRVPRSIALSRERINGLSFHEPGDRTLLAVAGNARVVVWDVEALRRIAWFERSRYETGWNSVAWCGRAGHAVLAAGTATGGVHAWDLDDDWRVVLAAPAVHLGDVVVARVAWAGEDVLASGGREGRLRIWSPRSWRCVQVIPIRERIAAIAAAPNGDVLVGTERGMVSLTPAGPLEG